MTRLAAIAAAVIIVIGTAVTVLGARDTQPAPAPTASATPNVASALEHRREVRPSRSIVRTSRPTPTVAQVRRTATARVKPVPASGNRGIGREMAAQRGWTGSQWSCLEQLWTKESGWSHNAHNSSSGAHGIPQSMPGHKMSSAGADWATNPRTQIRWGLQYLASRYGNPCGGWAHFQRAGWY